MSLVLTDFSLFHTWTMWKHVSGVWSEHCSLWPFHTCNTVRSVLTTGNIAGLVHTGSRARCKQYTAEMSACCLQPTVDGGQSHRFYLNWFLLIMELHVFGCICKYYKRAKRMNRQQKTLWNKPNQLIHSFAWILWTVTCWLCTSMLSECCLDLY